MFFSSKIKVHKYKAVSKDNTLKIRSITENDWDILSEYLLNNTLPQYREECNNEEFITKTVRMESRNSFVSLIEFGGNPIGEVKIYKHAHLFFSPPFTFDDPPLKNKKIYHMDITIHDKSQLDKLAISIDLSLDILFRQIKADTAMVIIGKDDMDSIVTYEKYGFKKVEKITVKKNPEMFQDMLDNCDYYYYLK